MTVGCYVTHFYTEREPNLARIVAAARPAVDTVTVCSNRPPAPACGADSTYGSDTNIGTRLRLHAALYQQVDYAVFIDDDVLLPEGLIRTMLAPCRPDTVVALWGRDGLVNGRAVVAGAAAIQRCVDKLDVLPGMWGDDILLGAVASDVTILSPHSIDLGLLLGAVSLDEGGVAVGDNTGYDNDRERTLDALRAAGLAAPR